MKNILVIGSGPIVIGQAAEFDYAGTQGCLALKELGYRVVLVNPNPATIMTDSNIADRIYLEPITTQSLTQIIRKEKIEGILPSLGGQTGLNAAMELAKSKVLDQYNVKLLGTSFNTIAKAEDRKLFKELMEELNIPVPDSLIVEDIESGIYFSKEVGYPLIIRPAYTLGGSGGGKASNEEELKEIIASGLLMSPVHQVLIEKDISGYKEIEFEVMRDRSGDKMVICTMENMDPVGIHTGDSIVFAPIQTMRAQEIEMLREASFKIMDAIDLQGGCNVQFAFSPKSNSYYVIEINPRVSRSSSLASKATGYAIAKMTAYISVGKLLKDMEHPIIEGVSANVEPTIDYVVCKIPRWAFDKFKTADRSLGTQMKATGEVMALGQTKEQAFLKAIRSLETGHRDLLDIPMDNKSEKELINLLINPTDERIFVLASCIRKGMDIETLHQYTQMDTFYLEMLKDIVAAENADDKRKHYLGYKTNLPYSYRKVDGSSGLRNSKAAYYYSVPYPSEENIISDKEKIIILGSGPIRIGQGVEFDYATVHCVKTVQELGYEAIVINNNPETVSTDFEVSDKLYFEPLTFEDVMEVVNIEKPLGVMVQFGGQTAINLASSLQKAGVNILGTSLESLEKSEDRDKFTQVLDSLNIPYPTGATATNISSLIKKAESIGYPVLVRPSFVIGGESMRIVHSTQELQEHSKNLNFTHPVLVDKYVLGKEVEVDVICDGTNVLIPGIMEHIEKAGVHSGDSMAIYPPISLSKEEIDTIVDISKNICLKLRIKGLLNIQFIIQDKTVYVIEVNPRASRTIPFLSKITGISIAKLATKAILGIPLTQMGLIDNAPGYHVKAPVFSFAKLRSVDAFLSPEMKSTGEVMGSDIRLENALYKAFIASGYSFDNKGSVLLTINDEDKEEAVSIASRLEALGIDIVATKGTHTFLKDKGIFSTCVGKVKEDGSIIDVLKEGNLQFILNTGDFEKNTAKDGFMIRRVAVEQAIPLLTSLDTAEALLQVLEAKMNRPWVMGGNNDTQFKDTI